MKPLFKKVNTIVGFCENPTDCTNTEGFTVDYITDEIFIKKEA